LNNALAIGQAEAYRFIAQDLNFEVIRQFYSEGNDDVQ